MHEPAAPEVVRSSRGQGPGSSAQRSSNLSKACATPRDEQSLWDRTPSRRVLIVGGTGFIGAHLVRRCIADGHEVHVLARPTSDIGRLADLAGDITLHRALPADLPAMTAALQTAEPEWIFSLVGNTAQRHGRGFGQVSSCLEGVADVMNLIEAISRCREIPRVFVRTGSIAEYGAASVPYREDQRERPVTVYGAALAACTHFTSMIAPSLPFPIVTARLSLIYGPGQYGDFLVPSLVEAALFDRQLPLERPNDSRDILHVSDAVEALVRLAIIPPATGAIINVGSGRAVKVRELAEHVATIVGIAPAEQCSAETAAIEHRLDINRLVEGWGWQPRVSLDEGLCATTASMRNKQLTEAA